jgi:hypothetical protein
MTAAASRSAAASISQGPRALRGSLQDLAAAACLFGAASALGILILVTMFKIGVLSNIEILFYRGLMLSAIAGVLTAIAVGLTGQRYGFASARDGLAAGLVSTLLNLHILILGPVTIERSLTGFVLGAMAATPDRTMTAAEIRSLFVSRYVGDWQQIERRLAEQVISGNIQPVGNGYRLTPRGQSFVQSARRMVWLFEGADPKFVTQTPLR